MLEARQIPLEPGHSNSSPRWNTRMSAVYLIRGIRGKHRGHRSADVADNQMSAWTRCNDHHGAFLNLDSPQMMHFRLGLSILNHSLWRSLNLRKPPIVTMRSTGSCLQCIWSWCRFANDPLVTNIAIESVPFSSMKFAYQKLMMCLLV